MRKFITLAAAMFAVTAVYAQTEEETSPVASTDETTVNTDDGAADSDTPSFMYKTEKSGCGCGTRK